jgi:hypothetical protein
MTANDPPKAPLRDPPTAATGDASTTTARMPRSNGRKIERIMFTSKIGHVWPGHGSTVRYW